MAKQAYYYYWSADNVPTVHTGDVYLLAAVTEYSDNDDTTSSLHGFNVASGYSLTVGGNPELGKTDKSQWNLNQSYTYIANTTAPAEESAVAFKGNGTVYFSAQTGAGGAREYTDSQIRISAYGMTTNLYSAGKSTNESAWSTQKNFSFSSLHFNPNLYQYPVSGGIGDVSAVTAEDTLTVGGSFEGYLEVKARHFSHGGHYTEGTTTTLNNSAIDTSTIAAGLRGDSVVLKGNFLGVMTVSSRADLASFSARTLTGNTVGSYAVYSKSALKVSSGAWAGQVSVSANSTFMASVHKYDTKGEETSESGVLSNNVIQAGAVKAKEIYINSLDSGENEDRYMEPIVTVDSTKKAVGQSVEIDGEEITFENSQGAASDASIIYDREDATFSWTSSANKSAFQGFTISYTVNEEEKTIPCEVSDVVCTYNESTKLYEYKYLTSEFKNASQSLEESIASTLKITPSPSGETISNAKFTPGEQCNSITWKRDTEQTTGGLVIVYTSTDASGVNSSQNEIYVSYDNSYLKYDADSGTYTFTPFLKDVLNKKYQTYTIADSYEIGTSTDSTCYAFSGSSDPDSSSYTLTWYAAGNVITEENTVLNYKLNGEDRSVDFNKSTGEDAMIDLKITPSSSKMANSVGNKTNCKMNKYTAELKDTDSVLADKTTASDRYFQYAETLDPDMIIYAEALNNAMYVWNTGDNTTSTMTDNIIQAIGLDAEEALTLNKFTNETIVSVKVAGNQILAENNETGALASQLTATGNSINAIGLSGTSISLHDFYGKVNVVFQDNQIDDTDALKESQGKDSMTIAALKTETLSGTSNLFGNLVLDTSGCLMFKKITTSSRKDDLSVNYNVAGYSVTQNMTVTGSLDTEITITGSSVGSFFAGYLIGQTLSSRGFDGTISINANSFSGDLFGIYAKSLKNPDCSMYSVAGSIDLSTSSAYRTIGIALKDAAYLYLLGTISVSGADENYVVKTDYGKDVSSGFSNDRLELGNGSVSSGIIDLGGGENTLTVHSGASFTGYVEHDVGKTNLIMVLEGEAEENAVMTINSERDAILVSGATFTVNCNDSIKGDTYKLITFDESVKSEADKVWKNGTITVSIQGKSTLLHIINGSGEATVKDGTKALVTVSATYADGTISVTVKDKKIEPESVMYSIGLDNDGNAVVSDDESGTGATLLQAFLDNYNIKNTNAQARDLLVKTTTNTDTQTSSSVVALNWIRSEITDASARLFELEYQVYDSEGNEVSNQVLRLSSSDTLKAEDLTVLGKVSYDLYGYNVQCVPDGGYVEWTVRDYVDSGMQVSAKSDSVTITAKAAGVKGVIAEMENLTALNPDDPEGGITAANVKFTWNTPESFYAIDHYDVEFFNSLEELDEDIQADIFAVLTKYMNEEHEPGGDWENVTDDYQAIYISAGEIKIRSRADNSLIYSCYTKQSTSNEILATGMNNQGYVYWRVKATDINDNESGYTDGIDFRVYADDKEGPVFPTQPTLTVTPSYTVNPTTGEVSTWDFSSIVWSVVSGSIEAVDNGSGVGSYVLEYKDSDSNWNMLYSWDAKNIFDEDGNLKTLSISNLESGTYTLRLRARDVAGNSGTSTSKETTVYLLDNLAPGTDSDTITVNSQYQLFTGSSVLNGYKYEFSWDAVEDQDSTTSMSTGVRVYDIEWKYKMSDGTYGYLTSYNIYGKNTATGEYELIKNVTTDMYGKYELLLSDDVQYSSFVVTSDEVLQYRDSLTQKETGYQYSFNVTVSDRAGNTRVLYNNDALDISTVPDLDAPTGSFSTLTAPTITVTERATITTSTTTTDDSGNETTTTTTSDTGSAKAADVTFTWSDTYTDDSGVWYLLQVSNTEDFNSDYTYTYLVAGSSDDTTKLSSVIYQLQLSGDYKNLRLLSVEDLTAKTVTFSNNYPTVDSGTLCAVAKKGTKSQILWRMKALDQVGNLNSVWSGVNTFALTDSERKNEAITDSGTPAQPTSLKIAEQAYNSSKSVYTGEIKVSWDTLNQGFGIDHYVCTVKNAKGKEVFSRTVGLVSNSGGEGNATTTTVSISTTSNQLDDGSYTLSVVAYGSNGKSKKADTTLSFVQDTVAPTASGTLSAKVLEATSSEYATVQITWGESTDATSGVSYYLLKYKDHDTTDWTSVKVSGDKTLYTTTLDTSKTYDFQVVAVDKTSKGNYSEVTSIEGVRIAYTDIDAYKDYDYTANGRIQGELIGKEDESDIIKVDAGLGEMRVNISSLRCMSGSGKSIVVSILDSQKVQVKKWTVSMNADSKSVNGQYLKLLTDTTADSYYIKVVSGSTKAQMLYDLTYELDTFEKTVTDDIAYTTDKKINGSGSVENIRIGYGDPQSYVRFVAARDGKYTFDLTKLYTDYDSTNTATFTLYKMKSGATSFTSVKTFTVSAKQDSNSLAGLLLDQGTYFIKLNAPKASSGANVRLDLDVTASLYTNQNNEDDFFANLKSGYCVDYAAGTEYLFGSDNASEWVGYGDSLDFRSLTLSSAGSYTFNLLTDGNQTGSVTMTVYQKKNESATSLSKVKSFTVKKGAYTGSLTMNMQAGEYYVSVQAANASKGDSISYYGTITGDCAGTVTAYSSVDKALYAAVVSETETAESVTTVLQKSSQYLGYGGSEAWYNLSIHGDCEKQTFYLEKDSDYSKQSSVTITVYKTNADGTKLSSVKSKTIAASTLGDSLEIKNLAAGNYVVKVSAGNASAGKSLNYTLKVTSSNYVASETVICNDAYFVGAQTPEELKYQGEDCEFVADNDNLKELVYYAFDTGDYAGEFNFSGNADFTLYTLKSGATSLTKLSGESQYLESGTTCYIAMENTGSVSTSRKIEVSSTSKLVNLADNDWAALDKKYNIDVDQTDEDIYWESWVGYGDVLSARQLTLSEGGKYNFSLDLGEETGTTPSVSMTLYKQNSAGTGVSAVKTLNAGKDLNGLLLSAGTYYAVVKANNAKGAADFTVTVTKDFLTQATDDNTTATAKQISVTNGTLEGLVNDSSEEEPEENVIQGWVGYGDEYDYYQLNLDIQSSGYYSFEIAAQDSLNFRLYSVKSSNNNLVEIYKYNSSGEDEFSFSQLLDKDTTYFFMVKSSNASKGGNAGYTIKRTGFQETYQINPDADANVSFNKTSACFDIEDGCEAKYTIELANNQTLCKYDESKNSFTEIKIPDNGVVKLSVGKYYIRNISESSSCEFNLNTISHKLTTTEYTAIEKPISNSRWQLGSDSFNEAPFQVTLSDNSTNNYNFTVSSTSEAAPLTGTLYVYVCDSAVRSSGWNLLNSYDLVNSTSFSVTGLLMDRNSVYMYQFKPALGSNCSYKITQNATELNQTLNELTFDYSLSSVYDTYFRIDSETAGTYTVDLDKGLYLTRYDAATGKESDPLDLTGDNKVTLDAGEYFIRGSYEKNLACNYELTHYEITNTGVIKGAFLV